MRWISAASVLSVCAFSSLALHARAPASTPIRVEHAWIRAAAQGQPETWAYATITTSGGADALVEVRSVDAGNVVLRATNVTDAGRKVRSVLAIPIPPASSVTLSADTYFIAFLNARHAFVTGQDVIATLTFASGTVVPVSFRITDVEGDPQDAAH